MNNTKRNQYKPKQTFWRKLIDSCHMTNKEIAKAIGVKTPNNISSYLSGALLPSEKLMKRFCDFYGVSYEIGIEEFKNANKEWLKEHNLPEKVPGKRGRRSSNTYWNGIKEKSDLPLRTVAKLCDTTINTVHNNFTGVTMPRDNLIKNYCELFKVDFDEGKQEFIKAYEAKHPGNLVDITTYKYTIRREIPEVNLDSILPLVYGEIACEDYNKLLGMQDYIEVMKFLYNKVDSELYANIVRLTLLE